MYDLLKLVKKRLILSEFFPLLNVDPRLEYSTNLLKPATDRIANLSSPMIVSDDNLDTSGDVLLEGIVNSIEQQLSNVKDRAKPLRCNLPQTRHPYTKLQDYVAHTIRYPITKFLTYQILSLLHIAFLTAISSVHDPKNFQEAQSQGIWQKAMAEELIVLEENKT